MQARINWAFAEVCDRATNVDELHTAFMREIRELGFTHAACASHVDPLRPPAEAVMMVDYPLPWLQRFSDQNYAKRDPVYWRARRQTLPFQWSDRVFRAGLAVLRATRKIHARTFWTPSSLPRLRQHLRNASWAASSASHTFVVPLATRASTHSWAFAFPLAEASTICGCHTRYDSL